VFEPPFLTLLPPYFMARGKSMVGMKKEKRERE
jgi:hypothetical protein